MPLRVVPGDLLEQDTEVIVNAWNRNLLPWWLLLPVGVAGAIRSRAGVEPFRELRRKGLIPLGGAVATGAGRLPHKAIIHVAGIDLLFRASERSVRGSVRSALRLARARGWRSVSFPLIGAGVGGGDEAAVLALMKDEVAKARFPGEVRIVLYGVGEAAAAP